MPRLAEFTLPLVTLACLPLYLVSVIIGFSASVVFFPLLGALSLIRRTLTAAKDSALPRLRAQLVSWLDYIELDLPEARRRKRTRSFAVLAGRELATDEEGDLVARESDRPPPASIRRRRSSGALRTWSEIVSSFKSPAGSAEKLDETVVEPMIFTPTPRPKRPPTPGASGRWSPKASTHLSSSSSANSSIRKRAGSGSLGPLTSVLSAPMRTASPERVQRQDSILIKQEGSLPRPKFVPQNRTPPMKRRDSNNDDEDESEDEEEGIFIVAQSSPARTSAPTSVAPAKPKTNGNGMGNGNGTSRTIVDDPVETFLMRKRPASAGEVKR